MSKRILVAAAGSLAMFLANAANAVGFVSGSFAFASFTSSATDVTTTTIFPLTSPVFTGSPLGSFAAVAMPATLTLPAGAVNFSLVGCCDWTDASLGTFVGTVAPVQVGTTPHPFASATWEVLGTYTVGPAFSNAGAVLSARMTWALTQTGGPTEATSISGTFQSPAVPEPGSLALLGLGLVGLGLGRRRNRT